MTPISMQCRSSIKGTPTYGVNSRVAQLGALSLGLGMEGLVSTGGEDRQDLLGEPHAESADNGSTIVRF